MLAEKKTGSFNIQFKGFTVPVDVYQDGSNYRFRITFGDASEFHITWDGKNWRGPSRYDIDPFVSLILKSYPLF